jgi:hypothetical protein
MFMKSKFTEALILLGRARTVIFAALLISFARSANASPIEVDLGPPHTITSQTPSSSFGELNGTRLSGQTMSIDFSFSNNEFVRLFSITSFTFDAFIKLQTNASSFLGFLGGTGYLVDAQGNAIPGFGITGSASGSDGSMALGLFPLLKDEDGTPNRDLPRPFDFYGIHYDLSFPDVNNPSIHIIEGEFTLISDARGVFGIGPGIPRNIVPDSGSTLFLLGTGVVFTIGLRAWRV